MLKIGDKVKIMIPPGDQVGANTVRQYNNTTAVIKDIRTFYKGKSSLGRTFILSECKSRFGIDYEFIEDWIVPLDEE